MRRLPEIASEQMTKAQSQVYQSILDGPRGKFGGPFIPLLYCPELCDQIQKLGETLRFSGSLTDEAREVAILVLAKHWKCEVEWDAHVVIGLKAGVARDVILAIRDDGPVPQTHAALIARFCSEINDTKFVSDETYRQTVDLLGDAGVVELTTLVGYYATLSMILNMAEMKTDFETIKVPDDLRLLPE